MSEKIILKKSPMVISVSSLFVLFGIVALFPPVHTLIFVGVLLIVSGILIFFFSPKQKIYQSTSSRIASYVKYFNANDKMLLLNALQKKEFSSLKNFDFTENGLQIRFSVSRDRQYAAVQLFDFVPYNYVESTPLLEYEGKEAQELCGYLCRNLK